MYRKGILATGNFIVDQIKIIDRYPHQDGLANIRLEQSNNGGSAYNILKNLSILGAEFPLGASGMIGHDSYGDFIINDCKSRGIDTSLLTRTGDASTSYTDVMTVQGSGRRTFFHHRGANSLFTAGNLSFSSVPYKILHLGYLLLLDSLDQKIGDRTKASLVLENAQNQGLITSIDIVSESSDRFQEIVIPSLPYTDYLFANEYEAGKITGVALNGPKPDKEAIHEAGLQLFKLGVKKWVFIHFPHGVYALSSEQKAYFQPSLQIPDSEIEGAAGAGDALAAAILLGLHECWPIQDSLLLGVCAAGASLFSASCSASLVSKEEALELANKYSFYPV